MRDAEEVAQAIVDLMWERVGNEGFDEEAVALALVGIIRDRDAEVRAEVLAEYHRFTSAVGFGDNVTERAATPEELIDPITQALSDAQEHIECAVTCEGCGEPLARETCEHCLGSGCGPGTATGAYEECEWCAGVGKVHPGCVERSYANLAADAEALAGFEWEGDGEIGPCVNTDHADAHAMPGPAWSGPDCRHERQVTRRRLVGPWEPDPRTPEQRSDDAIADLKHRLGGAP